MSAASFPTGRSGSSVMLVAAAAALSFGAAGVASAAGPTSPKPKTPTVFTVPVTSDRAVIGVSAPDSAQSWFFDSVADRVVTVRDADGRFVGRSALTPEGKALIPAWTPKNGTRELRVTIGDATARSVTANTTPAALKSSSWRIANKTHSLGTFAPKQLAGVNGVPMDPRAATATTQMFAAAADDGVRMSASTAYRGYGFQKALYDGYVASDGRSAADAYSARPGHSEHQTGFAFDARDASGRCHLQICFATTPAGKWLQHNATEYGFVIRYTAQNTATTGYQAEPWHLRYVGPWLAGYLAETRTPSLERAFGLPAAPAYVTKSPVTE